MSYSFFNGSVGHTPGYYSIGIGFGLGSEIIKNTNTNGLYTPFAKTTLIGSPYPTPNTADFERINMNEMQYGE